MVGLSCNRRQWITGPVTSTVLALITPLMIFDEAEAGDPQFIGALIGSIIVASIWTAYLSTSKRVRNTYCGSKNSQ
jgi:hypothetical protein